MRWLFFFVWFFSQAVHQPDHYRSMLIKCTCAATSRPHVFQIAHWHQGGYWNFTNWFYTSNQPDEALINWNKNNWRFFFSSCLSTKTLASNYSWDHLSKNNYLPCLCLTSLIWYKNDKTGHSAVILQIFHPFLPLNPWTGSQECWDLSHLALCGR